MKIIKSIIYKVTNTQTNEVYIGATTKTIQDRKEAHLQKAHSGSEVKFHEGIYTYGVEAFTWEQLDTASTTDELAQKEIRYIEKFNSCEQGYNSDRGGGFKKTIYRYNLDGSLNTTFDDLTSAGESIDAAKKAISKACWNVNHSLGGYLWSYDYVEPFIPNTDCRKKEVLQYHLNGNFLANYVSVSEASRLTGVSKSGIAKCCRGERNHSGGFIWKY
ncbi:MAG TPA: NUMOD1 domain-containing DNA-binding protein [Flavobacterium sp.]|uniref:NUMOD1 domain-containing DNA-binding protein n=1 Tax=Flavobacterium sp. TaxID=239 RepID=UPI002D136296|nr:NUMOD1 domain-containing DNA-binding protein [Flavobacterium sp.]HNP31796.1 NUMOD1 domain-containing DNA-binding protein [Flavobacterium sp.]